jgi:glycosyltransferase involved in cell wall biosynthesis
MVAPVFYPYPPVWPEGMVNAKLALAMRRAGWHIDIIIAGYPAASNRYPSDNIERNELIGSIHIVNEVQRTSFAQKVLNSMQGLILTGQVLRQLDWGISVLEVARKLHSKFNYDFIISRAVPDFAHFAALLIHRKTRVPWIANWNDPTPNHKFPPPYGQGSSSPLAPHLQNWYRAICKHCTWHTFPTERLRKYIISYLPGDIDARSSVIPHIAMEGFSGKPISHSGFSICYAGSVLPPREVSVFLEGVKRFRKLMDNTDAFCVRFLVDRPEVVADRAKIMGIEDIVKLEDTVPYSQMPQLLSQSDVLVIIEAPLEEGIFMPAKIVDYVQIGRPILALTPVIGTIVDMFSKHGGGISVDCQSPDAVLKALEEIYTHWKTGQLDGAYSSDSLKRFFSQERVLELYIDLFRRLSLNRALLTKRTAAVT